MNEVKVTCPYCNFENIFYPSRTAQLLDSQCINCDKSLYIVLYDLQLPKHHQSDIQSEDKTSLHLDIEEAD